MPKLEHSFVLIDRLIIHMFIRIIIISFVSKDFYFKKDVFDASVVLLLAFPILAIARAMKSQFNNDC